MVTSQLIISKKQEEKTDTYDSQFNWWSINNKASFPQISETVYLKKKKETVYKYTRWEGMQYCAICTKNTDLESYTN